MRVKAFVSVLLLVFVLVPWYLLGTTPPGYTGIGLSEAGTGRKIFASVLKDGEQVLLTWKNSLFGLHVTEEFRAQRGALVLTRVTFSDSIGSTPPTASAADLDDLYHTGGPFSVQGLARPFKEVVYRVGEIGDPKMSVRDRVVEFKKEVGFGGGVVLTATCPDVFGIVCAGVVEGWNEKPPVQANRSR